MSGPNTRKIFAVVHAFCLSFLYLYIVDIFTSRISSTEAVMNEKEFLQIDECWRNHGQGAQPTITKKSKKMNKKPREKKLLSLYYGDAAVETVSVLDVQEISAIEALAECTRQLDNSLYHASSDFNVTYLTGTYKEILPDIHETLIKAGRHGIGRAQWEYEFSEEDEEEQHNGEVMPPLDSLGIRQVKLISVDKGGVEEYQKSLKQKQFKKRTEEAFIFHPHKTDEEFREEKRNLRAHQAEGYKKDHDVFKEKEFSHPRDESSVYMMFVMLNEKSEFSGGTILVKKHPSHITDPFGEDDFGPVEDDADEDGNDPDIFGSEKMQEHKKTVAISPVFTEFAPDIGSVLIVKSSHAYGMMDIPVGRRNLLAVEFWVFQDTKITAHRPSTAEGVPFPSNHIHSYDL